MSKGPIQYVGPTSVREELAGGLQINQVYLVQVEAWTETHRNKTLSNHWRLGKLRKYFMLAHCLHSSVLITDLRV